MTDYILPPDLLPASVTWQLVDYTGANSAIFSGTLRTVSRGQRWSPTLSFRNLNGSKRRRLQALLAALQGKANRLWLIDASYQQGGSFPGGELFTNSTFANGTTGWTAGGSSSISASQGVMRTLITGPTQPAFLQSVALTQFVPYALRSIILDGLGTAGQTIGPAVGDGTVQFGTDYSTVRGLRTASGVAPYGGSGGEYPVVLLTGTGYVAGNYILCPYASLQQCALVDNAPNLLTFSNTFANGVWTPSAATMTDLVHTAPDGTITASKLTDTAVNTNHNLYQTVTIPSAANDYFFGLVVAPGTRSWLALTMTETLGSGQAIAYFNLSTGATGSTSAGSNWANLRVGTLSMGNGYFYCWIIARKTNAATGILAIISAANGNGLATYLGTATDAIDPWHAVVAQSSVPVRCTAPPTTASALPSGTPQVGSGVYLKGLPLSTNGLALAGDRCDIAGEHKIATADLNSDAANLGYLQFEPAFRSATIPDSAPVFFGQPLGRFGLVADAKWTNVPAYFSDFDLQLIEA